MSVPDSIINCPDPASADVVLLGAPYDGTSSFGKGADRGPGAIVGCLDRQIEFYERVSGTEPTSELKISYQAVEGLAQVAPGEMVERLTQTYAGLAGKFVLLLGGEHSVSNAPFRHFAAQSGQITVVQIDAHADLRQDDSDYNDEPHGHFAHCSVMRRAYDLGYHLVQVGIRAYSSEEQELFSASRIKVFEWSGHTPSVEEIICAIPTSKVYLSIDVDGLDPACMPATGTPVPGGLDWYYTLELIRHLFQKKEVISVDIVEVAPRAQDQLTEYAAAQLCYTLIGCWLKYTWRR